MYAACLLTTGNDINPLTTLEVAFTAAALMSGFIVNAFVFGGVANMVVRINVKFS